MNISLKRKLITIFISLQILTLSIIGIYLITSLEDIFHQQLDNSMKKEIQLVSQLITPALDQGDWDALQEQSFQLAREVGGRITVIAADGEVLADSEEDPAKMENHGDRPEVLKARGGGFGWSKRHSMTLDIGMKYLVKEVEPQGYVRLAIPLTEVNQRLQTILIRLFLGFFIAFSIFLILTWRVSEGITGPIKQITRTAQNIAKGNLGERIHIHTKDEIGTLSRMFNMMASQLGETIRNITNEKERLTTILEAMADGLVALNGEQQVILLNPAAAKMFGVTELESKGKSLVEMNRNPQLVEAVQKVYETKKPANIEMHLHFPVELILKSHIAPIIQNEFDVRGLVLIFTDMTELRRLERVRTEFVGNVSHELKTPLTSINGYVETLLDMELDDPSVIQRFLRVINKESKRLSRLIEDLLDFSKLEGRRHHQLLPTRLQDVIENVSSVLTATAKRKEIDLQFQIPEDLPLVLGVEEQLNQVVINLVENGIKYTSEQGKVVVSAIIEGDWVIFKVVDNGIGISNENQERIFERFYRVDKARSRQMGGTGLGLSIVKHIVKGHGGEISVESEVGVGSTFTVKLRRDR